MRLLLILSITLICIHGRAQEPTLGAIRWDGWFEGNSWQRNLDPGQWHYRLPFFAEKDAENGVCVVDDSDEVMAREIAFARAGGIDYWAFCYYHPKSWPEADRYNHGWKRYLAAKDRNGLRFCLLLQGGQHLGPREDWPETVARFIAFFKDPAYQRVLGGRPLLYVFTCENLESHFGGMDEARQALDLLRSESLKAAAGDPYIVAQIWLGKQDAPFLDALGFDALGAYSAHGDSAPALPHARLLEINAMYWNAFKATGRDVVPTVNAGWDGRPRDYAGSWFVQATPAEVAACATQALDWLDANSGAAPARTALFYAWNEYDEGGWLCPTLDEGSARLDAIAAARAARAKD